MLGEVVSYESTPLVERLRAYDPADLAAGIGALQLVPENADRLLRLEAVAELVTGVVLGAATSDQQAKMGPKQWRELLDGPSISNSALPRLEDPWGRLFVEQVTFPGGSYRVLPGIVEDAVFIVRHLIKAILL